MATFAAFAGASFYMGWIGQSSCGCAGSLISISPWITFGFDLAIVLVLVLARPDIGAFWKGPSTTLLKPAFPAACGIIGATGITALLLGVAHAGFGSVPAAVAHLRGDRISVSPRHLDLGTAPSGSNRAVQIDIANWTDAPIHVVGGASDCSCAVIGDGIPITIAPRETRSVTLAIRVAGSPGAFTRMVGLHLDDEGIGILRFRATGHISPDDPSDEP